MSASASSSAPLTSPLTPALAGQLRRIRHVALDMDGTLYKGGTLFPCTPPFLAQMREAGIGTTFLTNNPSKSIADYVAHLGRLGLVAQPGDLYTTVQATLEHLRTRRPGARHLFVLGTASMLAEFTAAGYTLATDSPDDEPDAVVVGFDLTLTYPRACRAAWWISRGKPFIATNPDRVCPTDQPTVLIDCGSICAMIEQASGRAPDIVLGKPDPTMLAGILRRHDLEPAQVAMVGDRIYTDMLMARRAGALGVLVLSGEATAEDARQANPALDLVVPSLAEFGALLAQARQSASA